jgi:hypothetical protein
MNAGPDTGDNVVRLRGLPFRASEQDIAGFLSGLEIARTHIVYQGGRPSGEAFVEFRNKFGCEGALQRNRQLMGSRYIEVFRSSKQEMDARVAGSFGGGDYGMGGMAGFGAYGAY